MGENWASSPGPAADHQLVRSGPFAVVRHPIYLALLCYLLSFGMALRTLASS